MQILYFMAYDFFKLANVIFQGLEFTKIDHP